MSKRRWIILVVIGLLPWGIAVSEYLSRRGVEHRYRESVDARHELEQQVRTVLTTHDQMSAALQWEQARSKELSDALASTRSELEQAVGRLGEEGKTARDLQQRLTSLQRQMEQLQSELAMAIEARQHASTASGTPAPVELERIVVTDAGGSGLRGRVLSVHSEWNFVVIDLGWDTVHIGDTVSIFRNEQLLAKARIERVQEAVCAATLLPGWNATQVQTNDVAKIL